MKNIKNIVLTILVLLLSLVIVACKDKKEENKEEDWESKTVSQIDTVEECANATYEYDEFTLDMIKILVTYTDGTSRQVPLTQEMLEERDLNKLKSAGNPRVYVLYEWNGNFYSLNYTIHLVDSALLDANLNKDGSHGAVIKAIRDKEQNKINFILEACESGVKALQFKYTCDANIMTLSNALMNSKLNGMFDVKASSNEVVATIVFDEAITLETTLFTVDFTGTFRTSKLSVDNTFANAVYSVDDNLLPVELTNVLYHASVK